MSWASEANQKQQDALRQRWMELWRMFDAKGVSKEVAELLLIERAPFKAHERIVNDL